MRRSTFWFMAFGWGLALVCYFEESNQNQGLQSRIELLEEYIDDNGLPTPAIPFTQGMTLGPGETTVIELEIK